MLGEVEKPKLLKKVRRHAPPPIQSFTCKYTKITFTGICPVDKCHANISADFRHMHECKSGCIFELYGDKKLGPLELSYVFDTTPRQVATNVKAGIARMHNAMQIRDLLSLVKEDKLHCCPECFYVKENSLNCLNQLKCSKRIKFVGGLLPKFPLSIKEFDFRTNFWKFMSVGMKVRSFNSLTGLLGLTEVQVQELKHLLNME